MLDAAGIDYMLAGSFASTYHGIPRTTQDLDLVVAPDFSSLKRLLAALPDDDYYVSSEAAMEALRNRRSFNVIDMATGWKADLIIRKAREFSEVEFARRKPAEIVGVTVPIATAEDTILSKLEWAQQSPSERQLRDVAGVLQVSGEHLDRSYLDHWADELGVAASWQELQDLAEEKS
ncbi:MAG: hypothetical protein GY898_30640 [Proteobacteria bacterium]|nr:hypothetical protein [Pseudomonadota bacterium]